LDTEFTTKFHNDPAFVSDVDALEDWEDFEALTNYANNQFGENSLIRIHPFGEELLLFREEKMHDLKAKIGMYKNFYSYINSCYKSLKMQYVPFPNGSKYIPFEKTSKNDKHAQKQAHALSWYSDKCKAAKIAR